MHWSRGQCLEPTGATASVHTASLPYLYFFILLALKMASHQNDTWKAQSTLFCLSERGCGCLSLRTISNQSCLRFFSTDNWIKCLTTIISDHLFF